MTMKNKKGKRKWINRQELEGSEIMGGSKSESGGIERVDDQHSLADKCKPNSRADLYKNGQLVQTRIYGPDGRAVRNIDWSHGGSKHEFPHEHNWDWSKNPPRQKATITK